MEWISPIIAIFGSMLSGYIGVMVATARAEERHLAMTGRVIKIEEEILRLRLWRHEKVDPYIADMNNMNRRVERVERKVFQE